MTRPAPSGLEPRSRGARFQVLDAGAAAYDIGVDRPHLTAGMEFI